MGASPEEKQPVLPPVNGGAATTRRREESLSTDCKVCLCFTGVIVALILFVSVSIWYGDQSAMPPEYSVAITAVSGLDLAAAWPQDSRRGVLYPVFNMTFGLTSLSVLSGGCIEPGTAVRVSYSYLRLPMAAGRAPELCVGPRGTAERAVVARGREVAIPGFMVDSLAEEMRRGEAQFEVKLTNLEVEGERWKVVTCWVRAGNAGAGASKSKPCVQSFVDIGDMPEPKPGDSGYVPLPVPRGVVPEPP